MQKNAEEKPKKKKPSKVLIVILVLFVLYCIGVSDSEPAAEATPSTTPVVTEVTAAEEAAAEILLVAGEQGEYGELITLNADTEFEETYYVYRLPAGTYTVTNVGEYANQFNVYGDTVYTTEEGWEELSDVGYVKLLDVDESDTVTIGDRQIIEIHEPGSWKLVKAE